MKMHYHARFILVATFLATFCNVYATGDSCLDVNLTEPTVEQLSFKYYENIEDEKEVKVRISWEMPELGDCKVSEVWLSRKKNPDYDEVPFIEEDIAMGGGVVNLESGRKASNHEIRYSLTLISSANPTEIVIVTSPSVQFTPTICSNFIKSFDFELYIQQAVPGTVDLAIDMPFGSGNMYLNCIQQLRIDYMEDPLIESENSFRGKFRTFLVEKDFVKGRINDSVSVNVPMDKIMSFRLSAGMVQQNRRIWFEGPTRGFKSTTGTVGCSDQNRNYEYDMENKSLPDFESEQPQWEDIKTGIAFNMDEEGETILVDWSALNVTNRECLNGFAVEYRWTCRTCDTKNVHDRSILTPPDEPRLHLRIEEGNFPEKYDYNPKTRRWGNLPVKERSLTVKIRTTWRLGSDAWGRTATAKFFIDRKYVEEH